MYLFLTGVRKRLASPSFNLLLVRCVCHVDFWMCNVGAQFISTLRVRRYKITEVLQTMHWFTLLICYYTPHGYVFARALCVWNIPKQLYCIHTLTFQNPLDFNPKILTIQECLLQLLPPYCVHHNHLPLQKMMSVLQAGSWIVCLDRFMLSAKTPLATTSSPMLKVGVKMQKSKFEVVARSQICLEMTHHWTVARLPSSWLKSHNLRPLHQLLP